MEPNDQPGIGPPFELTLTRRFAAPRELVYQCWTDPQHLKQWQGVPEGMELVQQAQDLRPGGSYRLTMRSPEGHEHHLGGEYRELVPPARLVQTHVWFDPAGNALLETLVTITFNELDGQTELTLHQTGLPSVGARDGHEGGWASILDRLASYLKTL